MRYSLSSYFAQALAKHGDAYAVHNRFAEAGDDGSAFGGSLKADAADAAEKEALDQLLLTPCRHVGDVAAKLEIMHSREGLCLAADDRLMNSLKRDLKWLSRPGASAAMQAAWAKWSCSLTAMEAFTGADEEADDIDESLCSAFRELLGVPCSTAGDFVAKAFASMLTEKGSTAQQVGASAFEPSIYRSPGTHYLNDDAAEAALDDFENCDLGRCMIMLGTLEFDANDWLRAADRTGLSAELLVADDGQRSFYFGELSGGHISNADRKRHAMLRALYCFDAERLAEIADEIEENFRHRLRTVPSTSRQQEAA